MTIERSHQKLLRAAAVSMRLLENGARKEDSNEFHAYCELERAVKYAVKLHVRSAERKRK